MWVSTDDTEEISNVFSNTNQSPQHNGDVAIHTPPQMNGAQINPAISEDIDTIQKHYLEDDKPPIPPPEPSPFNLRKVETQAETAPQNNRDDDVASEIEKIQKLYISDNNDEKAPKVPAKKISELPPKKKPAEFQATEPFIGQTWMPDERHQMTAPVTVHSGVAGPVPSTSQAYQQNYQPEQRQQGSLGSNLDPMLVASAIQSMDDVIESLVDEEVSHHAGSPVRLARGTVVYVYVGDITKVKVEAIVNASNKKLKHNGGVAKSIVKAGGKNIQKDSDNYIKKHGEMQVGHVMVTNSGKLPCKKVLHAVGPVWYDYKKKNDCRILVHRTIFQALKIADDHLSMKSLAMPPICSGKILIYSMSISV